MRRKAAAALAILAVLAVAAIAVTVTIDRGSDAGAGVENTRSADDIATYWTDERRRDASPG
ncbi:hypothetical protein [Streptosporangium sp. KLBMP 9127]|nr:hypothetical protein [Streptosporangium sp. KLBMP 9127]